MFGSPKNSFDSSFFLSKKQLFDRVEAIWQIVCQKRFILVLKNAFYIKKCFYSLILVIVATTNEHIVLPELRIHTLFIGCTFTTNVAAHAA
jgi:hypothetical protein